MADATRLTVRVDVASIARDLIGFHSRAVARSCLLRPPCVSRLRSEEHTSELQSHVNLVCRLLLEKKNGDKRAADDSAPLHAHPTPCALSKTHATPPHAANVPACAFFQRHHPPKTREPHHPTPLLCRDLHEFARFPRRGRPYIRSSLRLGPPPAASTPLPAMRGPHVIVVLQRLSKFFFL